MQVSSGGTGLVSQLYSANGVLRGADVMSNASTVYAGGESKVSNVGEQALVQLWNPTGSGKTILVDQLFVSSSLAGAVWIFGDSTQLTTVTGNWVSFKSAQPLGSGEIGEQSQLGHAAENQIVLSFIAAAGFFVPLPFPFVITENHGLTVMQVPLNGSLTATFFGREFTT